MPSFIEGMNQGLQTGMALDNWKKNRDRAPIIEKQQDDLAAINKQIADLQLENLKDANTRKVALQKINDAAAAVDAGKFNDPALVDYINTLHGAEINQGAGENSDIASKRVSHIVPVPGSNGEKFTLGIEVTKKDGTKYVAPWTQNRSSDPNDPVHVFSTQEAIGDMISKKDLIERMDAAAARLGDPNAVERQRSERAHKYKLEEIDATAKSHKRYGLASSGKSADLQLLDYFTDKLGYDPKEAMQRLSELRDTAKINPVEAARKLYSDEMDALEKGGITPDDPNYENYKKKAWESAQARTRDILDQFSKAPGLGLMRSEEAAKAASAKAAQDKLKPSPVDGQGKSFLDGLNSTDLPSAISRTPPAPAASPGAGSANVPPLSAFEGLQEGHARKFKNGTVWTIQNGQPVQVQ
jgi:hypothetical protein